MLVIRISAVQAILLKKSFDEFGNGELNEAINLYKEDIVDNVGKSIMKAQLSEQVNKYQGAEIKIKEKNYGEIATVNKVKLEDGTEKTFSSKLVE